MGKCFLHGNGGGRKDAALNFSIVGGTSAPANPSDNTIWINTDKDITGWIFSATEPSEPAEGMVWIVTGASSNVPINALKENSIWVYPQSAKQYVGDEWINVPAKTYVGQAWSEWVISLLDNDDITGGWTGSLSKLTASGVEGLSHSTTRATNKKIDFTNAKSLTCVFEDVALAYATVYVSTTQDINGSVASASASQQNAASETVTLDVSGLDSSYYVVLTCTTLYGISSASYSVSDVKLA